MIKINRRNFAAAGIALVLAVSVSSAVLIISARKRARTPDFLYGDPPPVSGIIPETEISFPETVEAPSGGDLPFILTSNNPRLYSKITFDGADIIIEGKCENGYIFSACLLSDREEERAEYDGDSFSITLKDKRPAAEYDSVIIYTSDEIGLDYRFRAAPEGFEPIDVSAVAEKNLYIAGNPINLPLEGVLQYITPDGDGEKAREVMAQIEEISGRICAGISGDYEKALAISEWVSENIYYDFDASHSEVTTETLSLSHVLETHRTVCGGYSNLFAALCSAQGITCINIRGDAVNDHTSYAETDKGSLHEWNYVLIGGRGIWVDTGWGTYNAYENGQYRSGGTQLKYFDITNGVMAYDHRARIAEIRDYKTVDS